MVKTAKQNAEALILVKLSPRLFEKTILSVVPIGENMTQKLIRANGNKSVEKVLQFR